MSWILADKAPTDNVTEMLAYCEDGDYWLVKRNADGHFWFDAGEGPTFVNCITHVARLLEPPGTFPELENASESVNAQRGDGGSGGAMPAGDGGTVL